MRYKISIGDEDTSAYIREQLIDYNSSRAKPDGPLLVETAHLVLKDTYFFWTIMGGISATINYFRARCYIDSLWVHEKLRQRGYGTSLLEKLEHIAVKAGCKIILVDTFSFQSPGFYARRGYKLYGKLEDFPVLGESQYFYSKLLK